MQVNLLNNKPAIKKPADAGLILLLFNDPYYAFTFPFTLAITSSAIPDGAGE